MSNKENVLRQLDTLGIPYVCYDHPAAYTMQDCYELPFVTPELLFCKNLLLCNRQQTSFGDFAGTNVSYRGGKS